MFEIKENILEKEVEEIIKEKIFLSILNDEEEVNFIEEDFIEILNDELQYPKDCDVNFIITKKYDGYQLYLSACGGSSRAGSMFQRFSKCFEKKSLHTYDQIYQEINNIYAAECALVEVREFSSDGRIRNVVNNIQKRPYYIAFGSTQEDSEKELYLKDISVGLTLDHRLFLYSETLKKRIRIVQDNMLNPQIENEIIKLLLTITEQEEYFPERRMINFLRKIEYNYIPRIKIEGVVISTRSWFLSKENLQCKNFQEFKRKFYDYKKKYKMDDICYYAKADNRVLLNLNDKEQLHILFKEHKKGIGLFFQELETNFDNISIISNQKNQSYLGEFVFSLVTSNVSYKNNSFLNNKNHVLDTKRRKNTLYEEGWIYFKLYVDRDKSNEILVDYLPNLIKDLNFPQHFFVRYSDSAGHHLRIRMNFSTSQCAIEKMPIILSWINLLMEKEMIKRVSFDTYVRENNRYGGNQLIELYEDVFFKDSILVEKILSHDSLLEEEMLEKWYIFGITHILMCLSEGPEDILKKLDTIANNKIYRNEYRKKCKNYISLINDILNKNFPLSKEIEREVKNIETALLLYKKQLQYFNKSNSLTNEINDIIFSIVHMHCNRLTGENLYERKYLEIVRNAMYHLIEVKKHYKM